MHLLRCLFFFVAIKLWSVHVPGVCNGAADALSRDNHTSFLAQVPSSRCQADVIPPEMLEVLMSNFDIIYCYTNYTCKLISI